MDSEIKEVSNGYSKKLKGILKFTDKDISKNVVFFGLFESGRLICILCVGNEKFYNKQSVEVRSRLLQRFWNNKYYSVFIEAYGEFYIPEDNDSRKLFFSNDGEEVGHYILATEDGKPVIDL